MATAPNPELVDVPIDAPRREVMKREVIMTGSVKHIKTEWEKIEDERTKTIFPAFQALSIIDSDMYTGPKDAEGINTGRIGCISILEMDEFTDSENGDVYKHWLVSAKVKAKESAGQCLKLRQYQEDGVWNTVKYGTQTKDAVDKSKIVAYSGFSVADTAMEQFCMELMHKAAQSKARSDSINIYF